MDDGPVISLLDQVRGAAAGTPEWTGTAWAYRDVPTVAEMGDAIADGLLAYAPLAGATFTGAVVFGSASETTFAARVRAPSISPVQNSYNVPDFFRPVASDGNWAYGIASAGDQYWMQIKYADAGDGNRGFRVRDVVTSTDAFTVSLARATFAADATANGVLNTNSYYTVDGVRVVGNQGAAVADADGTLVGVNTAINALLARLRASTGHGLIAT